MLVLIAALVGFLLIRADRLRNAPPPAERRRVLEGVPVAFRRYSAHAKSIGCAALATAPAMAILTREARFRARLIERVTARAPELRDLVDARAGATRE